jgi:hypothetical protein
MGRCQLPARNHIHHSVYQTPDVIIWELVSEASLCCLE